MSNVIYGVTNQGFIRKPLDVIISDLNQKYKTKFGTDFDTSPESPDGQVIGIISDELNSIWELAQAAHNSYRPSAVQGANLDAVLELNRVVRYVNVPSKATCQLDGDAGVSVPAGSIVSTEDGQLQFTTNDDIILPGSVTVTCTTLGEFPIESNYITKVVTEIEGWVSVNNVDAGVTGIEKESDAQVRARRDKSTIITGTNTVESLYDTLSPLNLSFIRIRDNDSEAAIGDQPPGSFQVVVSGGTDIDIAKAIYSKKPGGIKAYGTTVVQLKDSKGYPHDIGFTRPVDTPIYITVQFKRYGGSSNDSKSGIMNAIITHINSLQPGERVIWSKIFKPIQEAVQQIEVDSLSIGLSTDNLSTATLELDITQKPYCEAGFISVEDVTDAK
jgi:uncharacterized phage protein gp47/JayE